MHRAFQFGVSLQKVALLTLASWLAPLEVGCAAWVVQQSPAEDASLRAIQAVDAKVVWASGSKGTCLRTLDGGETWHKLTVPHAEPLDFRGLAAFDAQTAVLIASGEASEGKARIYRTEDGGVSWRQTFDTTEKGVFLDGVAFWSKRHGLVFGDPIDGAWYLLRTSDGGRTWRRIEPFSLPPLLPGEAAFAASNSTLVVHGRKHAWIASGGAERARVFRSRNRGKAWETVEAPIPSGGGAGIFSLHFWDASHGIGVGGDHLNPLKFESNAILTEDGGRNWRRGGTPQPSGLKEAVAALPDGTLIAVGPSGTSISRDRGISWQPVDTQALHAASCAQGSCWAAGGRGLVAKWSDK